MGLSDQIGEAVIKITADVGGVQAQLDTLHGTVAKGMEKIGKTTDSALVSMISFNQAFALFNQAKSIIDSVVGSSIRLADSFVLMSAQTGLTVKQIQEYAFVAGQLDVSMSTLANGFTIFSKNMLDLTSTTSAGGRALAEWGISLVDSDGNLRSVGRVLPEIVAQLQDMEDTSLRNRIAADIFGKGYKDLIPILNLSSAELQVLIDKANAGAVASTESVLAVNSLGDAWDAFTAKLDAKTINALGKLAKAFVWVIEGISALIDAIERAAPILQFFGEIMFPVVASFTLFSDVSNATAVEVSESSQKMDAAALRSFSSMGEAIRAVSTGDFPAATAATKESFSSMGDVIETAYSRTEKAAEKAADSVEKNARRTTSAATAMSEKVSSLPLFNGSLNNVMGSFARYFQTLSDTIFSNAVNSLIGNSMNDLLGGFMDIGSAPSIFGGGAGSGSSAGGSFFGFAAGGTPPINVPSIVGEAGPELFVPTVPGTIIPNNQLMEAGGGGVSITQNLNISTGVSATVRSEIMGLMPMIQDSTTRAVVDAARRGGSSSKFLRGS